MVANAQDKFRYVTPFKPTGMSAIPAPTNAYYPFMTDVNNAPVFKPTANFVFYPSMPNGNSAAPQAPMMQ